MAFPPEPAPCPSLPTSSPSPTHERGALARPHGTKLKTKQRSLRVFCSTPCSTLSFAWRGSRSSGPSVGPRARLARVTRTRSGTVQGECPLVTRLPGWGCHGAPEQPRAVLAESTPAPCVLVHEGRAVAVLPSGVCSKGSLGMRRTSGHHPAPADCDASVEGTALSGTRMLRGPGLSPWGWGEPPQRLFRAASHRLGCSPLSHTHLRIMKTSYVL